MTDHHVRELVEHQREHQIRIRKPKARHMHNNKREPCQIHLDHDAHLEQRHRGNSLVQMKWQNDNVLNSKTICKSQVRDIP